VRDGVMGLHNTIIWNYLLSVSGHGVAFSGILKATIYYPMRRTGRRASDQVTVPALASSCYVVVSEDSQ